jgi:ankyrin repeat protein
MSICQQFHDNPNINPRTGRKITRGKGIYNELVKECGLPPSHISSRTSSPRASSSQESSVRGSSSRESSVRAPSQQAQKIRAFVVACARGDLEVVRSLIEEDDSLINIVIKDISDPELRKISTADPRPLHIASAYCQIGVINELILNGAELNSRNFSGETPLFVAIEECDDLEVVKLLINSGANINSRNSYGETPLSKAVQSGNMDMVRELLRRGADINSKNRRGITPLIIAIEDRDYPMVKFLLDAGADPNVRDNNKKSVLALTVTSNQGNIEIVRELLKHGADINAQDRYGNTPLMEAIYPSDDYETVKFLLESGADYTIRNNRNLTARDLAVMYQDVPHQNPEENEIVDLLQYYIDNPEPFGIKEPNA